MIWQNNWIILDVIYKTNYFMQHIPLTSVVNNLPLYKNFTYTTNPEDTFENSLDGLYQESVSDFADSFFRYNFIWDRFNNELEFE